MTKNLPKVLSRNTVLFHKTKGQIANLNRRVSQYQGNGTVNTQYNTVNDIISTSNDTVTGLKKSLQKVYAAIQNNPEITHSEMM